jgi:hypothetical protein
MDDAKERFVMENFDLNKPDPAAFDMAFMIDRTSQGLSAAQALTALIEHKRTLSPGEYQAMMRECDEAGSWMQAELQSRLRRPEG